jgi:hypothetical protein
MIRERQRSAITGWVMLPVLLVLAAGALRFLFLALRAQTILGALAAMLLVVAPAICFGGNPVEIAAVVVWRVVDAAEAVFEVDSFENYVKVQTGAAIRNLASRYPYDSHADEKVSLRGSTAAWRPTSSTRSRTAWPRRASR